MSTSLHLHAATIADIPELVTLVNQAYRGTGAEPGWTHEAHLLEGPRIEATGLQELLNTPHATILTCRDVEQQLVGCVYLEVQQDQLYLGLLAVSPVRQAAGIGKYLLAAAENHARQNRCTTIVMTVLAARPDLLAWYARNGYLSTGETRPLHAGHGAGQTQHALTLLVLAKAVNQAG